MLDDSKDANSLRQLRVYVALVILLVAIALLSFLIVPQGNGINSCNRLVFASSKYACMSGLALSQSNASICGQEPGAYSDSCYMQVAERTNNSSTCSSISNRTALNLCIYAIATAESDYAACSDLAGNYTSKCYESIAIRLGNEMVCTYISNATYAAACTSIIGIRKAVQTENATYCSSVNDSNNKNLTNFIILNSSINSTYDISSQYGFILSSLALLPNVNYTSRDYCYISVASRVLNPALCSNVSAGEAANICDSISGAYSANLTENFTALLAACSEAGSYAQQCTQSATIAQAIKTRNATMCAGLGSGIAASCYSLLASTYKNATYCDSITNSTAKSACVGNT